MIGTRRVVSALSALLLVDFTFAGSSDLVTQLTRGARADVFASADTKNIDTLVIVTGPGNPKKVATFADLVTSDAGQKILLEAGFAKP